MTSLITTGEMAGTSKPSVPRGPATETLVERRLEAGRQEDQQGSLRRAAWRGNAPSGVRLPQLGPERPLLSCPATATTVIEPVDWEGHCHLFVPLMPRARSREQIGLRDLIKPIALIEICRV